MEIKYLAHTFPELCIETFVEEDFTAEDLQLMPSEPTGFFRGLNESWAIEYSQCQDCCSHGVIEFLCYGYGIYKDLVWTEDVVDFCI